MSAFPHIKETTKGRINLRTYHTREMCFGFSISWATITINLFRRRFECRWLSP